MSKDYGIGKCSLSFCPNPAKPNNRGYCGGHYKQDLSGQPFKPLMVKHESKLKSIDGWRRCTWCGEVKKEKENFYLRAGGKNYNSRCKLCMILINTVVNMRAKYGEGSAQHKKAAEVAEAARNDL